MIPRVWIGRNHIQVVQYEGMDFCFDCGVIGHSSKNYPMAISTSDVAKQKKQGTNPKQSLEKTSKQTQQEKTETYGPWNIVTYRKHPRQRKTTKHQPRPKKKSPEPMWIWIKNLLPKHLKEKAFGSPRIKLDKP